MPPPPQVDSTTSVLTIYLTPVADCLIKEAHLNTQQRKKNGSFCYLTQIQTQALHIIIKIHYLHCHASSSPLPQPFLTVPPNGIFSNKERLGLAWELGIKCYEIVWSDFTSYSSNWDFKVQITQKWTLPFTLHSKSSESLQQVCARNRSNLSHYSLIILISTIILP